MNNAAHLAAEAAEFGIIAALVTHRTIVIFRTEGGHTRRGTVVTLPTDRDPSGHEVGAYVVAVAGLGHFTVKLSQIRRIGTY